MTERNISSDTEPGSEESRNDAANDAYENSMSIESVASSVTEENAHALYENATAPLALEITESKEEVKVIDLPPTYEEVINNFSSEL